ncbi:hypothetical protein J437_LFUL000124 [Ladona fulva]|uniref:Uncharacterized protein n=1 Tax=Ladona fulva TaxID=123851 RepID=A0A8K0K4D6_LADFU|nr:hypothetical protein J437_LFUL000124 [Ladona fulva]
MSNRELNFIIEENKEAVFEKNGDLGLMQPDEDSEFYGLNSKGVKAMAEALRSNSFIRVLNLEDNHFTNEAVYHLREMLRVNATISELNLKGCKICQKGAEILALGIQANTSLKLLNLADNYIEDDGMKFLAKPFMEHSGLKNIILSGNNLFKKSAVRLGKMLEENCILEKLDLSWNHLNSKEGCKKLFAGLKINTSLECFDISWNGLDELAAGPLAECLSKNNILWYLDISNNRCRKLTNHLLMIQASKQCGFQSSSLLTAKPCKLLTEVLKVREVQVLFGGYKSDYQIKGPDVKELLLKRAKFVARKPKKRPKDFGQFILKLEDRPLKKEEFQLKLNEAKIKLDKDLVGEILQAFKVGNEFNAKEMKDYYLKLFPDTKLVVKAKKVKKKSKKEKKLGKTGAKSTKK